MLVRHRDRETTDRYTTADRLEMRNVLSLLPDIGRHQQEKGRREVADTYWHVSWVVPLTFVSAVRLRGCFDGSWSSDLGDCTASQD